MPPDEPLPSSVPPPLAGLRVLVVDDNEQGRELLHTMLVHSGAVVTIASGAETALDVLRTFSPNVIISDLSMPRRDGYWLVRMVALLRAEMPTIPAIAVTAYREAQPEARAYEAGFTAYLERPLDVPRLVATILKVLGHVPS